MFLIILALIFMISVYLSLRPTHQSGGKLELNFSDITDDISAGNRTSLSKRPNTGTVKAPAQLQPVQSQDYTFWGHQMPLPHETRLGKFYGQRIPTLSGKNLKVSPKCCPSTFSSSTGCVCQK